MHGAGIYKQRYGLDPGLGLARAEEVRGDVDAFVAEQEAKFGGDPGERRRDYELLQLFDRFSLYFCLRDAAAGEAADVQGYSFEPVAPWHVRVTPFPFAEAAASFSLLRRVLPQARLDEDEFRRELFATPPERTQITIEAGAASTRIAAARTGEP